jgi:UDP-N-acetyl-D-mannosaminuronate dehydrogenase
MVQLKETACVLGLGYIGLPLTAALANAGYHVIGVDLHPEKVENLFKTQI